MRHDIEETRKQEEEPRDATCCKPGHRNRSIGTAVFGLGILLFGTLLTLDNLDIIEIGDYWRYWPVLLIGLGLSHLLSPGEGRRIGWGLVWVFIGGVLLLDNLGTIGLDVWELWPVVLMFVGANLLWNSLRIRRKKMTSGDSVDDFDATAILGGVTRKITSKDFRGGRATALLGGVELDLRDATISGSPAEIEVFTFWGGIEIRVPQEWDIQVRGSAILGGFEDKSTTIGDGSQVLVISGTAFMAGVEIKN